MQILVLFLMLLILLWITSLFRKTFVLRKFSLEPDNADGNIVTIVARKHGFFAWILTLLFKISPERSLLATTKNICFRYKSISTEENALVTLKHGVSHIYCKYQRPFWLLILSIIVLLASIMFANMTKEFSFDDEIFSPKYYYSNRGKLFLIAGIIISVISFLFFYFKKSITIMIETKGGIKYGIKFKPSLIEGQDVNLKKAKEVVEVIQNQIIKEQM
jgi:hypothetical protein